MWKEAETGVDICRICLRVIFLDGVLLNSEDGRWLELYEYCFGITVLHMEHSNKICNTCVDKLKDFESFKRLAHKSEKHWYSSNHLLPDADIKIEDSKELDKKDDLEVSSVHFKTIYVSKSLLNDVKSDEENVFGIDTDTEITEEQSRENSNISSHENSQINVDNNLQQIESRKNRNFKCDICRKTFRKQKSLNIHRQSNRCSVLKKTFTKRVPVAPDFYCGLCDVTLPDRNQIIEHVTEHSSNCELHCKLCKFIGRDFADMVMHRYSHQRQEYKLQIFCHLCKKHFFSPLILQFHYRSKHLNVKGGWCSVCNKQFNTYRTFKNHERLHKVDRYICDICDKRFLFRHRIVEHMRYHSEYRGFICDICGKSFKRHFGLKHHLDTTHNDKSVKCHHCDKLFKNQRGLNNHLKYFANNYSHQCDICNKRFALPSLLKAHMIWHLDKRPFECNVCGLSYKVKSQLTIHMRKHTGVMPYKCDLCIRSFASSNQLKTHINSHTGKRRYKCMLCPRSFHYRKLLLVHTKNRHKDVGTDV